MVARTLCVHLQYPSRSFTRMGNISMVVLHHHHPETLVVVITIGIDGSGEDDDMDHSGR